MRRYSKEAIDAAARELATQCFDINSVYGMDHARKYAQRALEAADRIRRKEVINGVAKAISEAKSRS